MSRSLEVTDPGMPAILTLPGKENCWDTECLANNGGIVGLIDADPPMHPDIGQQILSPWPVVDIFNDAPLIIGD